MKCAAARTPGCATPLASYAVLVVVTKIRRTCSEIFVFDECSEVSAPPGCVHAVVDGKIIRVGSKREPFESCSVQWKRKLNIGMFGLNLAKLGGAGTASFSLERDLRTHDPVQITPQP